MTGEQMEKVSSGAGNKQAGRGHRALTQHSGSDCRLSTSSNCQGQTLSVSALRWTSNRDAVALCKEGETV